MLDTSPNVLACATRAQEEAFIDASINIWRARNTHRYPAEILAAAVQTVTEAYREFLSDRKRSKHPMPPIEGSSDALRRIHGILIKLSLSFASSGIAQASVHAGFAHASRAPIIWQPDRYTRLGRFTRTWIDELRARITELEGISPVPRCRTVH